MRRVLLIATNYLHEQRWAVISLALYAPAMAAMMRGISHEPDQETLAFFLQQQGSFAVIFGMLFAGAAIYNDRRSRRILSIISKAVRRREYIAGLLVGVWCSMAVFIASVAASYTLAGGRDAGRELSAILIPSALGMLAVAATALFFSTFLHPMFATVSAGIFLGMPALFSRVDVHLGRAISPVYYVLLHITTTKSAPAPYQLLIWCVIHTVIFWAAASWMFAQRDIAVTVD
jgi:ABC-type transport system involved in multi-copper enzyme maturation permease subunit